MAAKKVFIVSGNASYHELFSSLGFTPVHGFEEEPDLVVFTGGEDVSPELYAHEKHNTTYNNPIRDLKESIIFNKAKLKDIPMAGICRGAQFLNVMSGGEMYQDVTRHGMPHSITDLITGETVYVSSTHHQMMKPGPKAFLVASAGLQGERLWWDGEVFARGTSDLDYEVLFYENTNSLCFQPHPEFKQAEYEGMRLYFGSLLNCFLNI